MDHEFLIKLEQVIGERKLAKPESSYVASLHAAGTAKIARKVGEEAIETVVAAMSRDQGDLTAESADLLFHLMVLLSNADVGLKDVIDELKRREGVSGHDEKAGRMS